VPPVSLRRGREGLGREELRRQRELLVGPHPRTRRHLSEQAQEARSAGAVQVGNRCFPFDTGCLPLDYGLQWRHRGKLTSYRGCPCGTGKALVKRGGGSPPAPPPGMTHLHPSLQDTPHIYICVVYSVHLTGRGVRNRTTPRGGDADGPRHGTVHGHHPASVAPQGARSHGRERSLGLEHLRIVPRRRERTSTCPALELLLGDLPTRMHSSGPRNVSLAKHRSKSGRFT
jgi:hypothetical protein